MRWKRIKIRHVALRQIIKTPHHQPHKRLLRKRDPRLFPPLFCSLSSFSNKFIHPFSSFLFNYVPFFLVLCTPKIRDSPIKLHSPIFFMEIEENRKWWTQKTYRWPIKFPRIDTVEERSEGWSLSHFGFWHNQLQRKIWLVLENKISLLYEGNFIDGIKKMQKVQKIT